MAAGPSALPCRNDVAIVIVDAHPLLREGLKHILSGEGFQVIATASAFGALDIARPRAGGTVLFLIGIDEDRAATVCHVLAIRKNFPGARVILLADGGDASDALLAIRAGAHGYLLKTISCERLVKSLDVIMLGDTVLTAGMLAAVLPHPEDDAEAAAAPEPRPDGGAPPQSDPLMSSRERDVLRCLVAGESNKLIARKFAITEATVKVHIKAILRKIRVKNRTQAAIWAIDHDLAPPRWPRPALPAAPNGRSRARAAAGPPADVP
ncbi:response regulator transcription factor [Methylobacterium nigriterrae]|uniref:response regulator transcription factor n=1 Tax=Methylobacterium nigriterrae TaxID=3127512 RepID=UPI003013F2D6